MSFSKTFAKSIDGSPYTKWEEVSLTEEEEKLTEEIARKENIKIMKECIIDAKNIISEVNLRDYQTDLVSIAIALFEKRAPFAVHYKEQFAKEKFDKLKSLQKN